MKKLLLFLALLASVTAFSQGGTCPTATPFCAGAGNFIFQNSTTDPNGLGQVGCNFSTPNAAWFYLQIDEGGELVFNIQQGEQFDANGNVVPGTELDVDFIAWGPYTSPAQMCSLIDLDECDGCPNNTSDPNFYPSGNVIDCSYSGSYNETLTIHNAQPGQIYAVLLTNFSQQPGYINLNQTNENNANAGSTDCSIVCPLTVSTPGILCDSNPTTTVTATSGASNPQYTWYDTNGVLIPGATGNTFTVSVPGTYSVHAIGQIASGQTCEEQIAEFTVTSYSPPGYTPPTGLTACNTPGPALFNLNAAIAQMGINAADYDIFFYTNQQDALDVAPNSLNPINYPGQNGEVIWISLANVNIDCIFAASVTLSYDCQNDLYLCDVGNNGVENFDLSQQTATILGSLNPADYTVTYHDNQSDAISGANPITPDTAYPGNEGDVIYGHIEENANPANVSTTSFVLHLYPTPDAVLAASATSVCVGGTAPVITFTGQSGTAPYTFTYTINGGTPQTISSTVGNDSVTITIPTTVAGTFDIDLTNVSDAHCSTPQTESITVTVNPVPDAIIQAPIITACLNGTSPTVTIIGSGGTAPYTFTYTLGSGGPVQITSNAAGQATVSIPTTTAGTFPFNLLDVADANCTSVQDDSVTFTIKPLPDATAAASATSVC
ncbi:hypothetical protein HUK80_10080, partial [Flavobacterium sp. MAH-1]|nr:hypothetical protein [Flavobacterium agri]NYA71267.1 hypothetical protein [Flavobacterium agri]